MKKLFALVWALFMCLSLAACGNTESDDTQSGYETVMDIEFLDGMWSIDGTAKLYFDSTMTATSRRRPISSSTTGGTGAFISVRPALSLRKWTAEFSPIPWTR